MKDENSHPPSHPNNDGAIYLLNQWKVPVPIFPRWVLLIHEMDHYAEVFIHKAGQLERLEERIALYVMLEKWHAAGIVQINKSYAINVLRFEDYDPHTEKIWFDHQICLPIHSEVYPYMIPILHHLKHCLRRRLS